MGYYATKRNYKNHNINNSTLTLNGEHKIEGLDGFDWEYDDEEVDTEVVADGTGLFVENPSKRATIKIRISEASASSAYLWDLWEDKTSFKMSFLDTTIPDLAFSASKCRIAKAPATVRGKNPAVVEWVVKTVYMDAKGGSYSLESA